MNNSITDQNATGDNFFDTEPTVSQMVNFQKENTIITPVVDTLNGTELFSLFTADIIKEKVVFTR